MRSLKNTDPIVSVLVHTLDNPITRLNQGRAGVFFKFQFPQRPPDFPPGEAHDLLVSRPEALLFRVTRTSGRTEAPTHPARLAALYREIGVCYEHRESIVCSSCGNETGCRKCGK